MALNEKYKEELINIIHTQLPNSTIYLFGSRAINKETIGSDIDIAIDTGSKIPYETILKIMVAIDQTIIPMKIDLVDMQVVPDTLKHTILKEGIKWIN